MGAFTYDVMASEGGVTLVHKPCTMLESVQRFTGEFQAIFNVFTSNYQSMHK